MAALWQRRALGELTKLNLTVDATDSGDSYAACGNVSGGAMDVLYTALWCPPLLPCRLHDARVGKEGTLRPCRLACHVAQVRRGATTVRTVVHSPYQQQHQQTR